MTCNTVKNGTAEPEMEHIKSISKGHQFEDDPITQFESITKCETTKSEFFHFVNDVRYGSSPEALGSLEILLDVKTRDKGNLFPLESLENVLQYFALCLLLMLCTDIEFCILQSYHPETKISNFFIIKGFNNNNTLPTIIKQLIDCILGSNHVLNWAHSEDSELHGFTKDIFRKVPTFE